MAKTYEISLTIREMDERDGDGRRDSHQTFFLEHEASTLAGAIGLASTVLEILDPTDHEQGDPTDYPTPATEPQNAQVWVGGAGPE